MAYIPKKPKKASPICPIRELLDRVGDKWSVLLIVTLGKMPNNTGRFSEIKKKVEGISQRMLTTTLRQLERDGFIVRRLYPEIPPRVEYKLTLLGKDILSILTELKSWVVSNWGKIHQAREQFDSKK